MRHLESEDYHIVFNRWRRFDLYTTILAISGLILGIISYEIDVRTAKNFNPDIDPDLSRE